MKQGARLKAAIGTVFALAAILVADDARSGGNVRQVTPNGANHGFSSVYGDVPVDQVEFLSSSDRIKSAAASGAPSVVWEALEHGEKVECIDCIAAVAPLLYDSNAKTREIAAWWLRRRIFGVFGKDEVYQRTIETLAIDTDAMRRAYAAYALGEFFALPGIAACAKAVVGDSDARVRAAAASALGRLNDDGGGALGMALGDSDAAVKVAALGAASRINAFPSISTVAGLTMDANVNVRRRAVEVLDALHAKDAVAAVAAVAQNDPDPGVRAAACHALGDFGDASALPVVQNVAAHDQDPFVRDQALIALRRL
jgi:HEAT repeats